MINDTNIILLVIIAMAWLTTLYIEPKWLFVK